MIPVKPLALQQEGVVAVDALQLHVGDVAADPHQRADDLLGLAGRIEPVGRERGDQVLGAGPGQRVLQRAVRLRQVVVVHRLGDVQVRVGVEALHEAVAQVLQIRLHLELARHLVGERGAVLQGASEPPAQRQLRQVGDVADHARDRKAVGGRLAAVVVAAVPGRIGHDGVAADGVEGDALRGDRGRGRQHDGGPHPVGVGGSPTPAPACRPWSRLRRSRASRCPGGRAGGAAPPPCPRS